MMFKIGLDSNSISDASYEVLGRLFIHHGAKIEPLASGIAVVFPPHRSDGEDIGDQDVPPDVLRLFSESTAFVDCPLYAEVPASTCKEIGTISGDGIRRLIRIGDVPEILPILADGVSLGTFGIYTGRQAQEMLQAGYGGDENVSG
jgi:hypothetical protein